MISEGPGYASASANSFHQLVLSAPIATCCCVYITIRHSHHAKVFFFLVRLPEAAKYNAAILVDLDVDHQCLSYTSVSNDDTEMLMSCSC